MASLDLTTARAFGRMAILALLAGACLPDASLPPPGTSGNCGAAELQYLLGQPASMLATLALTPATRIIRPGEAVTMDYSPDRLDIELDAIARIIRISCG